MLGFEWGMEDQPRILNHKDFAKLVGRKSDWFKGFDPQKEG